MKRILLLLLVINTITAVYADGVDEKTARKAAENWYMHYAPASKQQATIAKVKEYKWGDRTSFFICSFDKGGFVLVSANDAVTPVLGYGFDHAVPDDITNEAVKGWFDNYARQIDTAYVLNLKSNEASAKWDEVLDNRFPKLPGDTVGPLLTTTWGQVWPYNAMCPEDPNMSGGHRYTGCAATALAQIMKYHNWPIKGAGEINYISNNSYPILVNFSEQIYNWESMPNSINEYNEEAAELNFSVGASVGSQYKEGTTSVYGSFSYNMGNSRIMTKLAMEIALSSFFKYSYDSTKAFIKIYDSDWIELMKADLDKARPIYYQGIDTTIGIGHAWVCDGYDNNDFFHFNFGWSGDANGFYSVSNINADGWHFNYQQVIITGIEPDTITLFIDSDTTISGHHTISTNIIIPRGVVFTIAPGSQVTLGGEKAIIDFGVIKSMGTFNSPIIITASDTNNRWKGIYHNDNYLSGYNIIPTSDTNIYQNTEISYSAENGLFYSGFWEKSAGMIIERCNFNHNLGKGLTSWSTELVLTNSTFINEYVDIYGIMDNNRIENNSFKRTSIMLSSAIGNFDNNHVFDNSNLMFNGNHWGKFNLTNNFFYGNNYAISCDMSAGNFINNLFVNNTIAFSSARSYGMKIINNTFSNNYTGMELSNNVNDTLYNNVIFNNNNNLILSGYSYPNLSHCLIENGLNGILNQTPSPLSQLNIDSIFDGDPDYINPSPIIGFDTVSVSNFSWNLGSISAALDMGKSEITGFSFPSTDIDGNPRINRSLDLGAYESLINPSPVPVVMISPSSMTVCEGNNLLLSAFIRGDSLEYEWFLDSIAIPTSNNDSLLINNSTVADTGNYICVAINSYGRDTTMLANIKMTQLSPLEIGEIVGPDTITWWDLSINYCVNNQNSTSYNWEILSNSVITTSNCMDYMATYTDSSGIIRVNASNICGDTDYSEKAVIINPFTPPEPYGILFGPSVVYRGETIGYFLDVGEFDIVPNYIPPLGFDWLWENSGVHYNVNNDTQSQIIFRARWQHRTNLYRGEFIVLPISVVDSINQLPFISGPDSISSFQDTLVYSIDSLIPASSYEWIWPAGLLPADSTTGRIARFTVSPAFLGGLIQVRGINPNWRGPYYEKNIPQPVFSINGFFKYNNTTNTVLDSIQILLELSNNRIDSLFTTSIGNYQFTQVPVGEFIINALTNKPWSGVNGTDALKIQRHFAGLETITEPVRLQAADVNNNGGINGTDAVQVKRRFAGMDATFERGDWTFAKPIVGGDTIIINGSNVIQDFYGLCVGDVNGSNIPSQGNRMDNNKVKILMNGTIEVVPGQEFDLPIRTKEPVFVNAISLVIPYPSDLFEVIDVKTTAGSPSFTAQNDEIRIAWSEIQSLHLKSGDTLILLRLKAIDLFMGDLAISLSATNESELADERGNVIPLAELFIPTIKPLYLTGIDDQILTQCTIFPNPANDLVNVEVKVSKKTTLDIEIIDMLGRVKIRKQMGELMPGMNAFHLNTIGLPGGVYTVKLLLNDKNEKNISLYKLVISK
jgi:hypothetical protein